MVLLPQRPFSSEEAQSKNVTIKGSEIRGMIQKPDFRQQAPSLGSPFHVHCLPSEMPFLNVRSEPPKLA